MAVAVLMRQPPVVLLAGCEEGGLELGHGRGFEFGDAAQGFDESGTSFEGGDFDFEAFDVLAGVRPGRRDGCMVEGDLPEEAGVIGKVEDVAPGVDGEQLCDRFAGGDFAEEAPGGARKASEVAWLGTGDWLGDFLPLPEAAGAFVGGLEGGFVAAASGSKAAGVACMADVPAGCFEVGIAEAPGLAGGDGVAGDAGVAEQPGNGLEPGHGELPFGLLLAMHWRVGHAPMVAGQGCECGQ